MRVSFAHHMLKKGLSLNSLQSAMNHRNISTTLCYLKVTDEDANEQVRNIINKKRRN